MRFRFTTCRVTPQYLTTICAIWCVAASGSIAFGQTDLAMDPRDVQIRDRYESSLLQNPFNEQAFDRVYEIYLANEGVATWVERLEARRAAEPNPAVAIVLARIFDRQFRANDAMALLNEVRASFEGQAELDLFLGRLHADAGHFDESIALLAAAADKLTDPEDRAEACRLLGEQYLHVGNVEKATAAWRRLVEIAPDDEFAYDELAAIFEENLMWAEAIAVRQQLIERNAANPYLQCRSWRDIGADYERMNAPAEAIAAYEKALDLAAPGNWLHNDVRDRLVKVYDRRGDLEGLLAYLDARAASGQGDTTLDETKATVLQRLNRVEEAEGVLKGVIERNPAGTAAYEQLLALYASADAFDKQVATYEQIIALFPADPEYLRRLGEAHLLAGMPEEAKAAWQRVVPAEPAPEDHALLAQWFERYEFPDEAIAAYERALEGKVDAEWTFALAELKHEKGLADEAMTLWKSVLGPESDAVAYGEVASVLAAHGKNDEAIPLYEQALKMDPALDDLRTSLANLFLMAKTYDRAVEHFQYLAESGGNEYFKQRGERGVVDTYFEQGILAEKQQAWEAEVTNSPEATAPRLRLAHLYERMGDRDRALQLYKDCVELEPENPEHLRRYAEGLTALRRQAEAIAAYEQLIEKDDTRAGAYLRQLVTLYSATGSPEKAVATAERVVELTPGDAEARLVLARTYINYDRLEDGLQQYRNALRLDPANAEVYGQYGEILRQRDRLGEAQAAFRKMLEVSTSDPVRVTAVTRLAEVYLAQSEIDTLLREFEENVRSAPKQLSAYVELAAVHKAAGDFVSAMDTIDSATEQVENKEDALRLLLSASQDAGRLDKVVETHEQIMAMSGEPTVYDWDQLAMAYAAMGDQAKALETWQKIEAMAGDDPRALKLLAGSYSRWGLQAESLEVRKRLAKADPTDYRFRLELAQMLAGQDQIDAALSEYMDLLETSQWEDPNATQAQQPQAAAGPMPYPASVQGWMFTRGARWGGQRLRDMRGELIHGIIDIARRTEVLDDIVTKMEKRAEEIPANLNIQEDLLDFYTYLSRPDDALRVLRGMIDRQPREMKHYYRLAGLLEQSGELDDAEQAYRAVIEIDESQTNNIHFAIARLYRRQGRLDESIALVEQVIQQTPDDTTVWRQASSVYQEMGDLEGVERAITKLTELDPGNAQQYRMELANVVQERGETVKARAILTEVILAPGQQRQGGVAPPARQGRIYVADPNLERRRANDLGRSAQQFGLPVDHYRIEALRRLTQVSLDPADLVPVQQEMAKVAETFFTATDADARNHGLQVLTAYICYLDFAGRPEEALALVRRIREKEPTQFAYQNLELYLMHRNGAFDEMDAFYEELAQSMPSERRNVALARANIALQQDDFDRASEYLRELVALGGNIGDLQAIASKLLASNHAEGAIALLEDQLRGAVQNPTLIAMLSNAYSRSDQHDKAIEWARRGWEQQLKSAPSGSAGAVGHQNQWMSGGFGAVFNAYNAAGRGDELVLEVEDRLSKQPTSTVFRQYLIQMYQQSGRVDDAIRLYKELTALRPNSSTAKTELAEFLMQNGRATEAIPIYEELLKTNPQLYFTLNWQIRQAYKQSGEQEKLAALEENVMNLATSPQELSRIANQWLQENEYERAAEAFERILRMDPSQYYENLALARAYIKLKRNDEALATLDRFLSQAAASNTGSLQVGSQVIDLYEQLGALPAIKERVAAGIGAPGSSISRDLQVAIATKEKRYDEALRLLEEAYAARPDVQILRQMAKVAEDSGDYDKAIELIEQKLIPQGSARWGQLAELYLKKGDTEKAVGAWTREASEQGGSWARASVIRKLAEHDLYDEIATYFRQAWAAARSDSEVERQLSDAVVDASDESPALREFVEKEVLVQDRDWTPDLVRNYLYRVNATQEKAQGLLSPMVAARPDDTNVLKMYTQFMGRYGMTDELTAAYEKLIEKAPDNVDSIRQYAQLLAQNGDNEKAKDLIITWAKEKPTTARIQEVANMTRGYYGSWQNPIPLRDEFVGLAAEEDRLEVEALFAESLASIGDAEWGRSVMTKQYEQNPDAGTADKLLGYLVRWCYFKEAGAAFDALAQKDQDLANNLPFSIQIPIYLSRNDADKVESLVASALKQGITRLAGSGGRGPMVGEEAVRELVRVVGPYPGMHAMLLRLEAQFQDEGMTPQTFANVAAAFGRIDDDRHVIEASIAALERNASDEAALYALIGAVGSLDQYDNPVSLLDGVYEKFKDSGQMDDQLLVVYIRALMESGRKDDAIDVIRTLRPDTGISGNEYVARAMLFLEAGAGEEALADLDAAGDLGKNANYIIARVRALGLLNRTDEIGELIEDASVGRRWRPLFDALFEAKAYDQIVEYFGDMAKESGDHWMVERYCEAMAIANPDSQEWRDLIQQSIEDRSVDRSYVYARLLSKSGLADRPESVSGMDENPFLRKAMCRALMEKAGNGDEAARNSLMALLSGLPTDTPEDALDVAQMWRELGEEDRAAEVARLIIADDRATTQHMINAASVLYDNHPAGSARAYLNVMKRAPSQVINEDYFFSALGRSKDEALQTEYFDQLASMSVLPLDDVFAKASVAFFEEKNEATADQLLQLVEHPELRGERAYEVAEMLEELEQFDAAIVLYERVLEGGCTANVYSSAAQRHAALVAKHGDPAKAMATFVQMSSFDRFRSTECWAALGGLPPADLMASAREIIAAAPSADYVSDLLVICADAKRNAGEAVELAALAADLGVAGRELDEAQDLDRMIRSWVVSEYTDLPKRQESMLEDVEATVAQDMAPGDPLEAATWRAVAPSSGIIWMDKGFDADAEEIRSKGAFAITDINCPADATVTFVHGSDDWVRIWANGELVFQNVHGRTLYPCQDSFEVALRAGENRITIQTGNNSGEWGFCLGMVDAPAGTTAAAPALVP